MLMKALMVGAAAVLVATPVLAQQRGTVEFGGFGSAATFDHALSLTTAYGGGGRVGMWLDPRWSLEFEEAEMRAKRPNGLRDVNVGVLSSRIVLVPVTSGGTSLLVGLGGGVSTETNFMHTYGLDVMAGVKTRVTDNVSFRVDGVVDWLANQNWKSYKSVRAGLSVYRHPNRSVETRTEMMPAGNMPMTAIHEDSVSAAETRRLRERDAALRMLRDSLRNAARSAPPAGPTEAAMETMEARIHFAFDKSELTDSAKRILDEKVPVFLANPAMRIMIGGYTDTKGTDTYNMALGERRAEVAKAYLVSKGVNADRVLLESKGERNQIPNTPGAAGQAANRRAVFQLIVTP